MKRSGQVFYALAGIGGALAVALGAGAAHGLEKLLSEDALAWINTGVLYQLVHLVAALALFQQWPLASWLWLVGAWLFAGSLYTMALLSGLEIKLSLLGPITPLGGLLLIFGWLALLWRPNSQTKQESGQ